jgi:peptide deformylase
MENTTQILLLGEEKLREISSRITGFGDKQLQQETRTLETALKHFRDKNGFGRAISAPQIGITKRLISLNLGKGTFSIFNPELIWKSKEVFTLWDGNLIFY